ncbi:DDE transposase [Planctomycetales bacterium]|nr:DDE transposase [Planctomycetales bacterium]
MVGVNRNTANKFYGLMRRLINQNLEKSSPLLDGEIEADKSDFGGVRKGKRGRGAAGKVAVFGLLKRGGKVYSQVIKNAKKKTLMPIIRRKIRADSVVYTDGFRAYNALDVSEFKHHRINHSEDFVDGSNHINGIENFWHQAKRHLRKFNGIPRKAFPLFLKECEFRFNYGNAKEQLKTLKKWLKIYNQNRQK